MFDWDNIVIEEDDNTVNLTAGEVALLVAADADTVTWGNITGDLAQQADLMLELDSKVGTDSPEFTGTPRSTNPPAGNSSNRIATTKFVGDEVSSQISNLGLKSLAFKDTVDYRTDITNKPNLRALAYKDKADYETDLINKPTLGALSSKDSISYNSEFLTDKPALGYLASKNSIDYNSSYLTNKPVLGALASKNQIAFGNEISNETVTFYVGRDWDPVEYHFDTIQEAIDAASPHRHTIIRCSHQQAYTESLSIVDRDIEFISLHVESVKVYMTSNSFDEPAIYLANSKLKFTGYYWIYSNYTTAIEAHDSTITFDNADVKVYGGVGDPSISGFTFSAISLYNSALHTIGNSLEIDYNIYISNLTINAFYGVNSFVDLDELKLSITVDTVFKGFLTDFYYETITGEYRTLSNNTRPSHSVFPSLPESSEEQPTEEYTDIFDIYVDSVSGTDDNRGIEDSPYKTIKKAVSASVIGKHNIIHVKTGGSYYYDNIYVGASKYIELVGYGSGSSIYIYGETKSPGVKNIDNPVVKVETGAIVVISGEKSWSFYGYNQVIDVTEGSYFECKCNVNIYSLMQYEAQGQNPSGYLINVDGGSRASFSNGTLRLKNESPYGSINGLQISKASYVYFNILTIDYGYDSSYVASLNSIICDGSTLSYNQLVNYRSVSDRILNIVKRNGGMIYAESDPSFGALAYKNKVDYNTDVVNAPAFGTLALKNSVNYQTEVINKPIFGALASKNTVDYNTDITNKPSLGNLAYLNYADYETDIWNKPDFSIVAPDFDRYEYYDIGDYVLYKKKLYRFIYKHSTGDWNANHVVQTDYAKELSTAEYKTEADRSTGDHPFNDIESEIRKAGAHAITSINLNYSDPIQQYIRTVKISGHKRITVGAVGGNVAYFNGSYGSDNLENLFYSIVVEDGAILELVGNITVYNSANNGILIRRGGTVIYRPSGNSALTINLPSNNYHDGIYVETGGKFIAEGDIVATRGNTIYESYPSYVINVRYGSEAHVRNITATNFNYAIGCTGGIASYNSVSGVSAASTSSGGRVFTGAQ